MWYLSVLCSQYRHSTPYVGSAQQYSVQPPGSGTFYPGPGPGDYPSPYRKFLVKHTNTFSTVLTLVFQFELTHPNKHP